MAISLCFDTDILISLVFSDPVGGSVNYLGKTAAKSAGLAYVQSNNIAVIKVDNSTTLAPGKFRNACVIKHMWSS